jgi:hypothetical protein
MTTSEKACSREPTSGLEPLNCSLRVIRQALQGVAQACKHRTSEPYSLLCFAPCGIVLRSRWCQSGVNHVTDSIADAATLRRVNLITTLLSR